MTSYHCDDCAEIPEADLVSVGPVRVSTAHLHLVPATNPDSPQARLIPPQEPRARRRFMQTYGW
jgi:hypothetical protein